MLMLFLIGVLEMVIATVWTKVVTKTKVLASGTVTMVNIMIWFYVLQVMVNDINNWKLALLYAFGCAVGTSGSIFVYSLVEKNCAPGRVRLGWKKFFKKFRLSKKATKTSAVLININE
jgi:uncharacterized protein YebE (UPF0316 family)